MTCQCDMPPYGKACHCRTCCLTFTGPWAFDKHLRLRAPHAEPWTIGMQQNVRGHWGKPADLMARHHLEILRGAG